MTALPESFYGRPTARVARDLVGKVLVRTVRLDGGIRRIAGTIVETEAYGHADDPASHACRGATERNAVMFGRVGVAYVYFTYGTHFCVNVSARSENAPAGAVLIRGVEPVEGADLMRRFRRVDDDRFLASGPGRLTQAMNISRGQNGADMTDAGSGLHVEDGEKKKRVVATKRIGITRGAERNWRFVDPSSSFLSRRLSLS